MASSFPHRSHFLAFNHVCCLTLANPLHSRLSETSVAEAVDGPSWMNSGSGVWWAIAPISGQVIKQLGLYCQFRDLPRRQRSNFRDKKQLFLGLHPNVRICSVPEHWGWWREGARVGFTYKFSICSLFPATVTSLWDWTLSSRGVELNISSLSVDTDQHVK